MKTFLNFLKALALLTIKLCLLLLFCFTKLSEELFKAINAGLSEHFKN